MQLSWGLMFSVTDPPHGGSLSSSDDWGTDAFLFVSPEQWVPVLSQQFPKITNQ